MLDMRAASLIAETRSPTTVGRRVGRFSLEIRQHMPPWRQALVVACCLILGLAISVTILVTSGVDVEDLLREIGPSIFANPINLSAVIVQAAPLIIVGLSAATAFRVRFWNIGIEGQMIFGSIAATAIAINDIGPLQLRLVLMMVVAALAGLLWIFVPIILRLRLGVNEIISTLLLNYIAFRFLQHLLYGSWRDPVTGFPNSAQYDPADRLGLIGWENLTYAIPLALLLVVLCWWCLNVSRFGFYTRFAYSNPRMAAAVGLPVGLVVFTSALFSGALSGLAGFAISAGVEYRLTQYFFVGYGLSGILIAFLARNNPLGAVIVSLFVAELFVVGQSLQVFYSIPGSMVQLIQAIIVIAVAISEFFIRHRVRWIRPGVS
jgi:ABC-type uncharacterized transport system permease subunit